MSTQINYHRLQTLSQKLHWLKIADDGVPELYLDHHSMSMFRNCEEYFMLTMVQGIGTKGRIWFLEFGIVFHTTIEEYYNRREAKTFELWNWLAFAERLWLENDLEFWDGRNFIKDGKKQPHKGYKDLGGLPGFKAMLMTYVSYFATENDHFRVIGTELFFGKKKEVSLLEDSTLYSYAPFRLYLTGKIDLLMDDGKSIGPMDHKTAGDFRGKSMVSNYEVQEGMTGYLYAAQKLVAQVLSPELVIQRQINKIWMNFVQVKTPTSGEAKERFSRVPIYKTAEQLEQFRQRQIGTASRLFQILNEGRPADWNTMNCNSWMHQECAFKPLHRQGSTSAMQQLIQIEYTKKPIWNPEDRDAESYTE
jgi:hypothetical protein